MKAKTYQWHTLVCLFAAGCLTLSSCSKDEGYDLGDVDTTLGIALNEFVIPSINSTMRIPLNDLFDISDSEVISTDEEGSYLFEKSATSADVKAASPSVDKITVVKKTGQTDFNIEVQALNKLGSLPSGVSQTVIDAAFDAVWDKLPALIEAEGKFSEFHYETSVDDDVQWLDNVFTDTSFGKSVIHVKIRLSDALTSIVSNISKLEVRLPNFLILSVSDNNGRQYETTYDDTYYTIVLTDVPTSGITLNLTIGGLQNFKHSSDDTQNQLVMKPNTSTGKQDIVLDGEAYMKMTIKKDDMAALKGNLKTLLQNNSTNVYQMEASTQLEDIVIDGAYGQFQPSIDLGDIGGVAITGLPDFLNGDNVRLVVANPQIYIDIDSDLGLDGLVKDVELTSTGSRVQGGKRTVVIPDLTIDRSTDGQLKKTSFVIYDEGNTTLTPPTGRNIDEFKKIPLVGKVTVKDRKGNDIQIGRLASLIYEIPDSIKFSAVGSTTLDAGAIELGYKYTVQPSYTFKAPLALSDGSYVIYNDSIDGWHEDLEDITLSGMAEVNVTVGEAINELPLSLTLNVTPKFISGTPASLKSKVQASVNKTIEAKGTTKDVIITLTVDGKEAFDHLDGLRFEATAESVNKGEIEALKENGQTLKFNHIGAKVSGMVVIDDDNDK